jgi:hypothetical protein
VSDKEAVSDALDVGHVLHFLGAHGHLAGVGAQIGQLLAANGAPQIVDVGGREPQALGVGETDDGGKAARPYS